MPFPDVLTNHNNGAGGLLTKVKGQRMPGRAYDKVRTLVEGLGGTMVYGREGHRHGAWIIALDEQRVVLEASGNRSFPELDTLHVPRPGVQHPKHWDDYQNQLVPHARERLRALLRSCQLEESGELEQLIERTKWRFAWTFARTYPHEYTTKKFCDLDDHARLIDCIESRGVVERFGKRYSKYFYFGERKYWHMGDPYADDPELWPNVINRTWVDVRRHAANVVNAFTPEELELQMRIWEIRLEETTDRPKREAPPQAESGSQWLGRGTTV